MVSGTDALSILYGELSVVSAHSIIIRPAHPEDVDSAIQIFVQAIRKTASADYSREQVDAWAQADRQLWARRWRGCLTWLATANGKPAGFAELKPQGHIHMIFIHPSFARTGVASALLGRIEETAVEHQLATLSTDASITARPFFARHEFRVVARQEVLCRGQRLTNFRMEKFIGTQSG